MMTKAKSLNLADVILVNYHNLAILAEKWSKEDILLTYVIHIYV